MAKIVMASNNRHKIKEIEAFLLKLCPNDRDGKPFENVVDIVLGGRNGEQSRKAHANSQAQRKEASLSS